MKRYILTAVTGLFSVLALAGCGGGGGGGSSPATKAVTKVYLFGNITSADKIVATVQTTMNVPSGVMLNYSSVPGATSGLCTLRKGVVVPSGPVQVSPSDFSASTYDIAGRVLTVRMVNNGRLPLKSSSTDNGGKGTEIAMINFSLATPGGTPSMMPEEDLVPTVSQEALLVHDVTLSPGCKISFATTYQ